MPSRPATLSLGTALALLVAMPASAATIVGLSEGKTLVTFDTAAAKVAGSVSVTGVESLIGIDVRPADGKLYGVTPDGTVVTIDPETGAATTVVKLKTPLPEGVKATVDFNPVADRLRLIGSDGSNLRANLADGAVTVDGTLKFADTDMHKGETPNIIAGAYTNSHAGTKETALFDIDGTIGGLIKQAPPNDGVLGAVGKLGIAATTVAFDIASDGAGGNTAYLVADGTLHTVDLATGAATAVGVIEGLPVVTDIAVLPAK